MNHFVGYGSVLIHSRGCEASSFISRAFHHPLKEALCHSSAPSPCPLDLLVLDTRCRGGAVEITHDSSTSCAGTPLFSHPHQHWLFSALKIMAVLVAQMAHSFFRVAAGPLPAEALG